MRISLSGRILTRLYLFAFITGTSIGIRFFLPYFILDLGGGLIELGLVSTMPTLVAALVQLLAGAAIDEVGGAKGLLVLGFFLSSLSAAPFLFVSTALMAILVAALAGIFNSLTIIWGVPNSLYMADLTPSERRAGIMSFYSSSWYLGIILGYFLAGFLAPIDWRFVFLVFIGVNLIAGLFLEYLLPEGRVKKEKTGYWMTIHKLFEARRAFKVFKGLPALVKKSSREFASFCLAISVRSIGVSMVMPITSFYLAEVLKASKPMIATLSTVDTAARVIPSPLLGWIADRWGRKKIFITGLIMMMIYTIIYISARDVYVLYPTYLLMGVAWSCNQATFLAWQMELAPSRRSMFIGLLDFMNNVSWAVGPLIGGVIGNYAGFWWGGVAVATIADIAGLVLLLKVPEKASQ